MGYLSSVNALLPDISILDLSNLFTMAKPVMGIYRAEKLGGDFEYDDSTPDYPLGPGIQ